MKMKQCPISTHVSRLSLGIITTMMTRNMTTAFMVTPKSTPSLSYFHKPLDHLHLPIRSSTIITPTLLFSTPPTKRVPRRNLKKRPNRRIRDGKSRTIEDENNDQDIWQNSEKRSLIRSRSIEAGEDYWIDEDELLKSEERKQAIKNRKALEGEISKEKLKTEVLAPYKQNWIGFLSVFIIVIATIISQFPELLQSPLIPIPDL